MLPPFRVHQPTSVNEAVSLRGRHGEDSAVYAGGTELLLAMKEGLLRYHHLVDVKTVTGLGEITYHEASQRLRIGAAATHRALELSSLVREEFPLIALAERQVANVRVRNVGTIGGNLCFAEPHSDPGTFLLLYDAEVEAQSSRGQRTIPLAELTQGPYETRLEEDELLTHVVVPKFPGGMKSAYAKFGHHQRPSLSLGVAIQLETAGPTGMDASPTLSDGAIQEVRIAVGSVGPKAVRAREAEELLRGKSVAEIFSGSSSGPGSPLERAGELAAREASPMDDLHGSSEYKEYLVTVFFRRTLLSAISAGVAPRTDP